MPPDISCPPGRADGHHAAPALRELLNLHLGSSFYDYLNDCRHADVSVAASRRAHGREPWPTSPTRAGFNNRNSFCKVFQPGETELTPSGLPPPAATPAPAPRLEAGRCLPGRRSGPKVPIPPRRIDLAATPPAAADAAPCLSAGADSLQFGQRVATPPGRYAERVLKTRQAARHRTAVRVNVAINASPGAGAFSISAEGRLPHHRRRRTRPDLRRPGVRDQLRNGTRIDHRLSARSQPPSKPSAASS